MNGVNLGSFQPSLRRRRRAVCADLNLKSFTDFEISVILLYFYHLWFLNKKFLKAKAYLAALTDIGPCVSNVVIYYSCE